MESKIVIKANKEGLEAIQQMVDIVLKSSGIQNLQAISIILQSVKLIPEKVDESLVDDNDKLKK